MKRPKPWMCRPICTFSLPHSQLHWRHEPLKRSQNVLFLFFSKRKMGFYMRRNMQPRHWFDFKCFQSVFVYLHTVHVLNFHLWNTCTHTIKPCESKDKTCYRCLSHGNMYLFVNAYIMNQYVFKVWMGRKTCLKVMRN